MPKPPRYLVTFVIKDIGQPLLRLKDVKLKVKVDIIIPPADMRISEITVEPLDG